MVDYSNKRFDLYFESDYDYSNYLEGLKRALDDIQNYISIPKKITIQAKVILNKGSQLGGTAPSSQYTVVHDGKSINIPSSLFSRDYTIMDINAEFYHQDNRWTFNGGSFDFVAIAVHELYHGLGFYSNIEPFFDQYGLYTTTIPKQEMQKVFLPPTLYDYHIECDGTRLVDILDGFSRICISKANLINTTPLAVQVAAYDLVPKDTRDRLKTMMTTPGSCYFKSDFITMELYTSKEMPAAVLSHSANSEPDLMHSKYREKVSYGGTEGYEAVLQALGYGNSELNYIETVSDNCQTIVSTNQLQDAQSRIDAGEFNSASQFHFIFSLMLFILF